jgi:hypothetical protein
VISLVLSVLSLASLRGTQLMIYGWPDQVMSFLIDSYLAIIWSVVSLSLVHMIVIKLANGSFADFEMKLDENQTLANGLDEGVCILDKENFKVVFANKAAEEFAVQTDMSFQMNVT